MQPIRIKNIMRSPVVSVRTDELFSHVEEKFRRKGIRHLPVIDAYGKVVGLITQRDLYRHISPRVTEEGTVYDEAQLNSFMIKHVMSPNPVTLAPDDSLAKAVELMAANKFGCIPIVDKNQKPVGILTETDILQWLAAEFKKM